MGRGSKQIDGQLNISDFSTNISNYVVQSNTLISGKQSLKINSLKIIRAAIMQVVRDDTELNPYIITISEISQLLKISKSNVYRDIESIVDDIMSNPVQIKEESGNKLKWVKIPWVKRCEYNSDVGLLIKLNEELNPYLLNLREYYTQYPYEEIIGMKSIYSIRLYELLQSKIMTKRFPAAGINIVLTVQEIREACDCEDKLLEFYNFRNRVLETAKNEIEKSTYYTIDYNYVKRGRKVHSIDFHIGRSFYPKKSLNKLIEEDSDSASIWNEE